MDFENFKEQFTEDVGNALSERGIDAAVTTNTVEKMNESCPLITINIFHILFLSLQKNETVSGSLSLIVLNLRIGFQHHSTAFASDSPTQHVQRMSLCHRISISLGN